MSTISRITFTCVLLSIFASSCAIDPYQEGSIQKELAPGRWQISYGGSKGATVETLQTNWLYRAAALTISEGYDGFEIVTRVRFDSARGLPSATNDDVSYFGQRAGAVGAVTAYLADAVI